MWSNFPDGGAGTNLKHSLHIIGASLLILTATKNLTNFVFNHDRKDWHSLKSSDAYTAMESSGNEVPQMPTS